MPTSFLFLLKRITIVDPKAVSHRTDEARMVLIEADEEQAIVVWIRFQIHCAAIAGHLSTKTVAFCDIGVCSNLLIAHGGFKFT